MPITPKLFDARATKIDWKNGDRMIVRHTARLSSSQRAGLRRSCKAFAGGADVQVIVVCVMEIEIGLIRADGRRESLCGASHVRHQDPGQPAVANVSCSRVELGDGDKIVFRLLGAGAMESVPRKRIVEQLARWAGDVVEIVDLSGEPSA